MWVQGRFGGLTYLESIGTDDHLTAHHTLGAVACLELCFDEQLHARIIGLPRAILILPLPS